jgi:hypothetical protein
MKKSFKKFSIVLLALAAGHVQSKKDTYQPTSPWPLAPIEDVVVGVAGVATLDHVGPEDQSAASGLVVAIPDAIPGVSYARRKSNDKSSKNNSQSKDNGKSSSNKSRHKSGKKYNDESESSH